MERNPQKRMKMLSSDDCVSLFIVEESSLEIKGVKFDWTHDQMATDGVIEKLSKIDPKKTKTETVVDNVYALLKDKMIVHSYFEYSKYSLDDLFKSGRKVAIVDLISEFKSIQVSDSMSKVSDPEKMKALSDLAESMKPKLDENGDVIVEKKEAPATRKMLKPTRKKK